MNGTAWHRTVSLALTRPAWRPARLAIDPRAFRTRATSDEHAHERRTRNVSSLKWPAAMWLARAGVAIPLVHALLHAIEAATGIHIPHSEYMRLIP